MQGFNDLTASLITVGVVVLSWCVAATLKKLGIQSRAARNFLHLIAGLWGCLWLNFQSHWVPTLFAFLSVLTLSLILFSSRLAIFNALASPFSCNQHGRWGVLLYALSLFLITVFLWNNKSIGTAVIFSLSLGDGLADAVGSRFGKTIISIPWNRKKTLEGSLACFLGAVAAIFLGFWLTGRSLQPYIPLMGGAVCTLVEALSPSELDNLLISIFLSGFLFLVS